MARPIDLGRVQSALSRLDAIVATGRLDPYRTAAWMAGELPEGPTMTATTTSREDVPTSLRVPESLLARADALRPFLARDRELAATSGPRGVSRSLVLRLAVERGIAALEAEAQPEPASAPTMRAELEAIRAHVDTLLAALAAAEAPR